MEAEDGKIFTEDLVSWEEKYSDLRKEYEWLWREFKRVAKLLEAGNGKYK